jgi:hypothetical protein
VDSGGGAEVKEKIAEIDSEITRISDDITQIDSLLDRVSGYVESETEAGTYLGKTLYKRVYHETGVITETTGGGGYSHVIDADFALTKEIVAIIGTYYTQSGAQVPFPHFTPTAGATLVRVSDERGLEVWSNNQIVSNIAIDYQIVIYYTKKS